MMVTSPPCARKNCETTWPKRPKPMISTEPRASEKSSGAGSVSRYSRLISRSLSAASGGANSMVRGGGAEQHGQCGERRQQARLRGVEQAERQAEREEHEGEFTGRHQHCTGAQ